ncbi:MAG TPA: RNA 2',3'-cyclic phosphodiesterase [Candidatus Sulfotelmatobacter sp.]
MRLFIALDLHESIRENVSTFVNSVKGFAPGARWARPESLHVTLKFIGQMPEDQVPQLQHILTELRAKAFEIHVREYGFFPTAKAARVFWIGIHAGAQLAALAHDIDARTSALGIPREEHSFNPHLTIARRSGGSGSRRANREDGPSPTFRLLAEKLVAMGPLDFGSMAVRRFFLYQSKLSPTGSRYSELCEFPLT